MNIGQLKQLLATSELPDSAEILIAGRHSFHVCRAEELGISDINQYGQAQADYDGELALVFQDRSTG